MAKKKPATRMVLDCSVVLAWFFEDESSPYADAVQAELDHCEAIVPSLWPLEVANVIIVGERRKRTTEAKATQFLTVLAKLPITVDSETAARAWGDVVRLARTHSLSVYDATYLELAFREGLPLATLDGPLKKAAQAGGISIFTP